MDRSKFIPLSQLLGEETGARKITSEPVFQTNEEKRTRILSQIALLVTQKYLHEKDLEQKAILVFNLNDYEFDGVASSLVTQKTEGFLDVPFLSGLVARQDLEKILTYFYGEEATSILSEVEYIPLVIFDSEGPILFDIGTTILQ